MCFIRVRKSILDGLEHLKGAQELMTVMSWFIVFIYRGNNIRAHNGSNVDLGVLGKTFSIFLRD